MNDLLSKEWSSTPVTSLSLAAGLIVLVGLKVIQERTVLTGTSYYLDSFLLCPGMHKQQNASELNRGELPATAAMTTGYVFRTENPATVVFFQKIGRTGHLVILEVSSVQASQTPLSWLSATIWYCSPTSSALYLSAIFSTLAIFIYVVLIGDWWACIVLSIFIISRLSNVWIVKRRTRIGWKGELEPGEKGDLLILLSLDRWIRLKGDVDDIKAITSGQWMREMTIMEISINAIATILVYINIALVSNAKQVSQIAIGLLLVCSAALLGLSNNQNVDFTMFGRSVKVVGKPKAYPRRRILAEELIKSSGRDDWAVQLGMIPSGIKQNSLNL
jgi:hypothetical protein